MNPQGRPLQWRDSARRPRLWGVDARLPAALAVWVLWPNRWSFLAALLAIAFLAVAEWRGYRPGAALRAIRRRLAGEPRALDWRRCRRAVDYGAAAGVVIALEVLLLAPATPAAAQTAETLPAVPAGPPPTAGLREPAVLTELRQAGAEAVPLPQHEGVRGWLVRLPGGPEYALYELPSGGLVAGLLYDAAGRLLTGEQVAVLEADPKAVEAAGVASRPSAPAAAPADFMQPGFAASSPNGTPVRLTSQDGPPGGPSAGTRADGREAGTDSSAEASAVRDGASLPSVAVAAIGHRLVGVAPAGLEDGREAAAQSIAARAESPPGASLPSAFVAAYPENKEPVREPAGPGNAPGETETHGRRLDGHSPQGRADEREADTDHIAATSALREGASLPVAPVAAGRAGKDAGLASAGPSGSPNDRQGVERRQDSSPVMGLVHGREAAAQSIAAQSETPAGASLPAAPVSPESSDPGFAPASPVGSPGEPDDAGLRRTVSSLAGPARGREAGTDSTATAAALPAADPAAVPAPSPPPSGFALPDVAALLARSEALAGFELGAADAPVRALAFVDPACPYSRTWVASLGREAAAGRVRARVIPVAVLGADSVRLAAAVAGSPDPASAWTAPDRAWNADLEAGAARLAHAIDVFDSWLADAVPFTVFHGPGSMPRIVVGAVDPAVLAAAAGASQ